MSKIGMFRRYLHELTINFGDLCDEIEEFGRKWTTLMRNESECCGLGGCLSGHEDFCWTLTCPQAFNASTRPREL